MKIFLFFRDKPAQLIVDAFWRNKLQLRFVPQNSLKSSIWDELRPSVLESNIYGSGMYIVRTRITRMERILLLT